MTKGDCMLNFKNNVKILCTLFVMLFTAAVATPHQPQVCKQDILKKYVSTDAIVFSDGQMFVVDEGTAFRVDSLHQDEEGVFVVISLYGRCPYGHPYSRDGGCYGPNCPFN